MPQGIEINTTPALFPGTTCKTCNRAVYVKDVDRKGNCVFCQTPADPAPAETPATEPTAGK